MKTSRSPRDRPQMNNRRKITKWKGGSLEGIKDIDQTEQEWSRENTDYPREARKRWRTDMTHHNRGWGASYPVLG